MCCHIVQENNNFPIFLMTVLLLDCIRCILVVSTFWLTVLCELFFTSSKVEIEVLDNTRLNYQFSISSALLFLWKILLIFKQHTCWAFIYKYSNYALMCILWFFKNKKCLILMFLHHFEQKTCSSLLFVITNQILSREGLLQLYKGIIFYQSLCFH